MKITIEIDCTSREARDVLGLPDVKPFQDMWLEQAEAALQADPDKYLPDALIRNWTKAAAPGFDALPEVFQAMLRSAASDKT